MRRTLITALFWLVTTTTASAQANCVLYDTLARINAAMTLAVENPGTATMKVNLGKVENELFFLEVQAVPTQLIGTIQFSEIDIISQQLATAQRLINARNAGESLLLRQLSQPEIKPLLKQADALLTNLACKSDIAAPSKSTTTALPEEGTNKITQGELFGRLLPIIFNVNMTYVSLALGIIAVTGIAAKGWKVWRKKQRRRARRFEINLKITFATGAINYQGRLCDISRVGCKLNHLSAIPANSSAPIKLFVAGYWIEGKIRWSDETFCGVAFDRIMTRAEVSEIRRSDKDRHAAILQPKPAMDIARPEESEVRS